MKSDVSKLNSYLVEALQRVEPVLEGTQVMDDVEIDECIVSRKKVENLFVSC